MIDLAGPFRGSAAVAAGLVTKGVLRGSRFRRLYPDVYVPAGSDVDLALRGRAGYLLAAGHGAVGGYAAAELLDASCGPAEAPVEIVVGNRHQRRGVPGVVVRRHELTPDDLTTVGGVTVTTPVRTAFDLARWAATRTEKVVAVDALSNRHGFGRDEVMEVKYRNLGAHGSRCLPHVLRLADPRAQSPMESRVRMALHDGGLPAPAVQHPVPVGHRHYYLDLAYPQVLLAIEYDGELHRSQRRAHRDLLREAALVALGWTVLRFDAYVVMRRPDALAAQVATELVRRGLRW
ncbi:MAG: endonuclease domain-containing protein [Pseudonocardia sp.]